MPQGDATPLATAGAAAAGGGSDNDDDDALARNAATKCASSMCRSAMRAALSFGRSFGALRAAPRELWLVYAVNTLESYAYFQMSLNFTVFLSAEYGYSDVTAGALYGAWGILVSVYGFFVGFLIDRLGVRRSLLLGGTVSAVGRAMFALIADRWAMFGAMFVVMPLGMSMVIPVATLAMKRYTTTENRTVAFSMLYSTMNVGAVLSGPVTDIFNRLFAQGGVDVTLPFATVYGPDATDVVGGGGGGGDGGGGGAPMAAMAAVAAALNASHAVVAANYTQASEPAAAAAAPAPAASAAVLHLSALRIVFALGALSTAAYTLLVGLGLREINVTESGVVDRVHPSRASLWATVRATCTDRIFFRLMLFSFVLIGARSVFRVLDSAFPKYLQRELGADVAYGTVYSIEPLSIIFLVPLLSAALAHYDIYKCIVSGTLISALSVLVLCAPASYTSAVLFVVVLSLGEAVYSSRVNEYLMLAAPNGAEGVYTQLSAAPLFGVKLLVGVMSGALLQQFCPAEPPRDCWAMWLVVGFVSLSTPLLLLVFWRCIHTREMRARISRQAAGGGVGGGGGDLGAAAAAASAAFGGRRRHKGGAGDGRHRHGATGGRRQRDARARGGGKLHHSDDDGHDDDVSLVSVEGHGDDHDYASALAEAQRRAAAQSGIRRVSPTPFGAGPVFRVTASDDSEDNDGDYYGAAEAQSDGDSTVAAPAASGTGESVHGGNSATGGAAAAAAAAATAT